MPSLISVCTSVIRLEVTDSVAMPPGVNAMDVVPVPPWHGERALVRVVTGTDYVDGVGAVGQAVQGGCAVAVRRCLVLLAAGAR